MDFNLKRTIATVAPAIAASLGTPIAGAAVHELTKNWLGKDEGATDKELDHAIRTASPEQLEQLQRLDMEFQAKMEQLKIDVFALEVEDRKAARSMSADDKWPQLALTIVIFLAFGGTLLALALGAGQGLGDTQVGMLMVGALISQFSASCAFWFGTTRDSQRKTNAMAQQLPGALRALPKKGAK